VNNLSHLYVAAHLDEMFNLAANERLAAKRTSRESKVNLGAAAKSVWSFLSGPAERPTSTPILTDYPYRG
jgi:hypothetical protein